MDTFTNPANTANCSLLISRTDFTSYVQELNSTTDFNLTLLESCKGDICNALWGDGNADISGIGVCITFNPLRRLETYLRIDGRWFSDISSHPFSVSSLQSVSSITCSSFRYHTSTNTATSLSNYLPLDARSSSNAQFSSPQASKFLASSC